MRKPRIRRQPGPPLGMGVALAIALGACGAPEPDMDRAIGSYLERHGIGSAESAGDAEALVPLARRVALTVVSARDLPDMDAGPGVTDPYVIVTIDGQRHRSTVISGSLNPVWGDSFVFDVRPEAVMEIALMDEDTFGSDDRIGVVSRPLETVRVGETLELEIPFRDGAGGVLTLRLTGMAHPSGPR